LAQYVHAPPDQTDDETVSEAVCVQIAEVFEQGEHVDEDVVVTLHDVDGATAVSRYPLQSRHAFVRQVSVYT